MQELILKTEEPDCERKSCCDCQYFRAAVSWWCVNEECSDVRGTRFPGIINCPYWKPARSWEDLSWRERWFGDFFVV
jgi:hypothetical protein